MKDKILILVLLAAVGVGSYFLYKKLKEEPPPDEVPPVVPVTPILEVYLIRWEDEQPFQVMSSHKAHIMLEDLAGTGVTFTIVFYLNSEKVGTVITKEASIGKVFRMPSLPGTYTFTAKVNDEEFSLGIVEVIGVPAVYGTVLVGVYDTQGNPLAGARVALNAEVGATDSGGLHHFLDVEPGTYQVAASISGYESQTKSVTVGIRETKVVEFKLVIEGIGVINYFRAHGKVVDSYSGLPLSGVRITVNGKSAITGASGLFDIKVFKDPMSAAYFGNWFQITYSKAGYKEYKPSRLWIDFPGEMGFYDILLELLIAPPVEPPLPEAQFVDILYATTFVGTYTYDPMLPAGTVTDGMTVPIGYKGRVFLGASWQNLTSRRLTLQVGFSWWSFGKHRYAGAWGSVGAGETFVPSRYNEWIFPLASMFEGGLTEVKVVLQVPQRLPTDPPPKVLDERTILIRIGG